MWQLNQTKQCKTCPWRKDSSIENIPEYCANQHQNLHKTITDDRPVIEQYYDNEFRIMMCHYNTDDNPIYCIGWIHNQKGIGNNIQLRLALIECKNAKDIEVLGEQVKTFKDTFN